MIKNQEVSRHAIKKRLKPLALLDREPLRRWAAEAGLPLEMAAWINRWEGSTGPSFLERRINVAWPLLREGSAVKTAMGRIHSLMVVTTAGAPGNTVGQPATRHGATLGERGQEKRLKP